MAFVKQVVFWFLAVLAIWLAVANREAVPFHLDPLPYVFEAPLYLLLFAVFLAGLVVGSLASYNSARRRLRIRQRRKNSAYQTAPAAKEGRSALSKEAVLSDTSNTDEPSASQ